MTIVCFMRYILVLILSLLTNILSSQPEANHWVDSLMMDMTEDEKLGQLFMIRAFSTQDSKNEKLIKKLIKEEHIGGLCFFQGTPAHQAKLTNIYQKMSDIPLLISMDAEWGVGMRLKKQGFSFPRQLTLGAIQDNNAIYDMGKIVAEHCKMLGVHINFAPVVDINNNAANPVINDRSFGEDKYNVAAKSYAYMKGMQDNKLIACAKHFPGHGDTDVDSHYDLPILNLNRSRLDSLELMPFRSMIDNGIKSIMVAHLHVPILDNRPNRATTLSKTAVTQVLKKELLFNGLIFTDALDMKGVAKHFDTGVVDAEALLAGNDVLLLSEDVKKAKKAIKKYIEEGKLDWSLIDNSVRKILYAKHDQGLYETPVISNIDQIEDRIKSLEAEKLKYDLTVKSMTLLKNDQNIFPIRIKKDAKYASLSIGVGKRSSFQKSLEKYKSMDHHQIAHNISQSVSDNVIRRLIGKELVFISLHDMDKTSKNNFGLSPSSLTLINDIARQNKVILTVFGSPYSLKYFESIPNILLAYDDANQVQEVAAQSLMGVYDINGKLPVSASTMFPANMGIFSPGTGRLGYIDPSLINISMKTLDKIDGIVEEMIKKKAAPGCQIFVAKSGNIVFNKSYGHHTYKKNRKVKNSDLYDVASITKILATTVSLMKLEEEGKINLKDRIGNYITGIDTSDKSDLIIEDVLAHHAKLPGWIPFYKHTITDDKRPRLLDDYYKKKKGEDYQVKVARDIYLRNDYPDSIFHRILGVKLRDKVEYKYSDLGFYLFEKMINNITGLTLDEYVKTTFYEPMGLKRIDYNPLEHYSRYDIAPSEEDLYFRNQRIQGYVHDMGAAMLGGVGGHAGLFSTAEEIGVMMQMLLNHGVYAGKRFLKPETIEKFTTRYPISSRRGLGFDMKELDEKKTLNISEKASDEAFGHLGFTGASVYADPKYDLVFVFLSNRTYPSMENRIFGRNEYRPRIQSVVYEAILDKEPSLP